MVLASSIFEGAMALRLVGSFSVVVSRPNGKGRRQDGTPRGRGFRP